MSLQGLAQQPTNDAALLQEVKLIRTLIEQTGTLSARTQLIVRRMEATDRRIGQLTAQLEIARKEVLTAQADREHALDLTARSEAERNLPETPAVRKAVLAVDIEKYKRRADAQMNRESQAKAVEIQIGNDLNAERNRQLEDNARLDEIERALASLAAGKE